MDASRRSMARNRDALLREHKDQMALSLQELLRPLRIRALAGGGSVLTARGIISPTVARTLSVVVDPASQRHFVAAIRSAGWREAPVRRRVRLLPPVRRTFVHDRWIAGLNIFSVIPGFFADPEETFDLLWERRREVPVLGQVIPGLDRLASAVLASHNSLDGRGPHASSQSDFFAEQFRRVLLDEERAELGSLVRQVGGGAEMSAFLDALDIPPVPFQLPSVAYVRWRLRIEDVSDQTRRAVALVELPRRGRRQLYANGSGRPHSLGDVRLMFTSLPGTARAILGSRRRWAAEERDAAADGVAGSTAGGTAATG
jgi:hypothetical protein